MHVHLLCLAVNFVWSVDEMQHCPANFNCTPFQLRAGIFGGWLHYRKSLMILVKGQWILKSHKLILFWKLVVKEDRYSFTRSFSMSNAFVT